MKVSNVCLVLFFFWFCMRQEPAHGDPAKNDLFISAINSKGLKYGEFRKLILDEVKYENFLYNKLSSSNFPDKEIAAAMLEWGKSKNEMLKIQSEVYVDVMSARLMHAGWAISSFSVNCPPSSDLLMLLRGGASLPKKKLSEIHERYMIELALKGLTVTEYDKKYFLNLSEMDGSEVQYLGIEPYNEDIFKRYLENYRGYAIAVLGCYDTINAVPVLKALLSDKNESRVLREIAARSLGMINDISSVEVLVDLLNGDNLDIQKQVRRSLIQLTGEDFHGDAGKYQEWILRNSVHFENGAHKTED